MGRSILRVDYAMNPGAELGLSHWFTIAIESVPDRVRTIVHREVREHTNVLVSERNTTNNSVTTQRFETPATTITQRVETVVSVTQAASPVVGAPSALAAATNAAAPAGAAFANGGRSPPTTTVVTQRVETPAPPGIGIRPGSIRVAVMSFENTGRSARYRFLERTIADSVSTSLSKATNLTVVSRLAVDAKMTELATTNRVGLEWVLRVGKTLGANAVIRGGFIEESDILLVNYELLDTATAAIVSSRQVRGTVGATVFDLLDEVAASVIRDVEAFIRSYEAERK